MSAGSMRVVNAYVSITLDDKELKKGLKSAKAQWMSFANSAKQVGASFLGLGAAIVAPFALAAKQFAGFEQQMKIVGAVTQSTTKDFRELTMAAQDLGLNTTFTAEEAGKAMEVLGRAGFKTKEILQTIPAVLKLSRATATELEEATRVAAATLRVFGLEAEESGRVVDVLAATSVKSAQSVEGLGEGLKFVGPFARQAGMSLEQTSAALGILADNGIRGTVAGTGLARILKNLSQTAKIDVLKSLGIDVSDSIGNMRSAIDILKDLYAVTSNSGSTERLSVFEGLFGRGAAAAITLAQTGDQVDILTSQLKRASGTASDMAKVMDDSLAGSFRLAESAASRFAIAVGEAVAPAIRKAIAVFRLAARMATFLVTNFKYLAVAVAIGGVVIATVGALTLLAGIIAGVVANAMMVVPFLTLIGIKLGIITAAAPGAAAGIATLTTNFAALQAVLIPFAILAAKVLLILGAIALVAWAGSIILDIMAAKNATAELVAENQKLIDGMDELSRKSGTGKYLTMDQAAKDAKDYAINIAKAGMSAEDLRKDLWKSANLNDRIAKGMQERLKRGKGLADGEKEVVKGEIEARKKRAAALRELRRNLLDKDFAKGFGKELKKVRDAEKLTTKSALLEIEMKKEAREAELKQLKELEQAQKDLAKAQKAGAIKGEELTAGRMADADAEVRANRIEEIGAEDPKRLREILQLDAARKDMAADAFEQELQIMLASASSAEEVDKINDEYKKRLDEEKSVNAELKSANQKVIEANKAAIGLQNGIKDFLQKRLNEQASAAEQKAFQEAIETNPERVVQAQEMLLKRVEDRYDVLAQKAAEAAAQYKDTGKEADLNKAKKAFENLQAQGETIDRVKDFRDRAQEAVEDIDSDSSTGSFSLAQSRATLAKANEKIMMAQLDISKKNFAQNKKTTDEIKKINTGLR